MGDSTGQRSTGQQSIRRLLEASLKSPQPE
jgi:hypothetical protein